VGRGQDDVAQLAVDEIEVRMGCGADGHFGHDAKLLRQCGFLERSAPRLTARALPIEQLALPGIPIKSQGQALAASGTRQ
jgi:hypothetical protein